MALQDFSLELIKIYIENIGYILIYIEFRDGMMGYNNKFLNKKKSKYFYFKPIVLLLSGIIMIGHGARMIYQGIFQKESFYAPATFDLFFDWLTLLILGFIVISFAFITFYHKFEKNQGNYKDKNVNEHFINPS